MKKILMVASVAVLMAITSTAFAKQHTDSDEDGGSTSSVITPTGGNGGAGGAGGNVGNVNAGNNGHNGNDNGNNNGNLKNVGNSTGISGGSFGGKGGSATGGSVGDITAGNNNGHNGNLKNVGNTTVGDMTTGASTSSVGNVSNTANGNGSNNKVIAGNGNGNGNGNIAEGAVQNSNSYSSSYTSTYKAAASSAYAPNLTSSDDTCMGSSSVGGSGVGFGFSVGSTWTDSNCVRLKNARQMANLGERDIALHMMCTDATVKAAAKAAGSTVCDEVKPAMQSITSVSSVTSSGYHGADPICATTTDEIILRRNNCTK